MLNEPPLQGQAKPRTPAGLVYDDDHLQCPESVRIILSDKTSIC